MNTYGFAQPWLIFATLWWIILGMITLGIIHKFPKQKRLTGRERFGVIICLALGPIGLVSLILFKIGGMSINEDLH